MPRFKFFFFLISLIASGLLVSAAQAASLYLLPQGNSFTIGDELTVDVIVDSDSVGINAAQATVNFPAEILRLKEASKQGSVFSFWVEEPVVSNDAGTVRFIGGTPRGISGSSLKVLRLQFTATGAGKAGLTVSDAAVTASDGKGTNVLAKVTGANLAVGTQVIAPPPPPPAPEPIVISPPAPPAAGRPTTTIQEEPKPPPAPVERPEKIIRAPVKADKVPPAPVLRVPLYPDQTAWYNHRGEAIVLWDLTSDIIQVATQLSHSPDKRPGDKQPELYSGKSFGFLEEGIWYIRAQFRNNVGWGELSYHKISLDTTPPVSFDVEMLNNVTDDPAPVISFATQDSLSGLNYAFIFVDDKEPERFVFASSTEMKLTLPAQAPGQHRVRVKVFDRAGNSVEDDLEFEILPLPTPTIDFVSPKVVQGEAVFVSGQAIPNGRVSFFVADVLNKDILAGEVESDGAGHWAISLADPLARGDYTLRAMVKDNRGAASLVSPARAFRVRSPVILSFGFIDLGWFEIFLIAILFIVSGFSVTAWYYVMQEKKREAYQIIAGRDIDKLTSLLEANLNELEGFCQSASGVKPALSQGMELYLKKIRDTIGKMKKYLGQEVEKLK